MRTSSAIFGDAALTNGISFEAMNNIAHTTKKFIGILNDNEWGIAKNVGAISTYLNRLITHPSYNKLPGISSASCGVCPRANSP
jgi:1-deoxy-D-xylulose-5-phosphate synthase